MKRHLPDDVERGRIAGVPGDGPHGCFSLVHPETGRRLQIIAADAREWSEIGLPEPPWEHVSVSNRFGIPTWSEMCWVKSLFWEPEELVLQFHPPESQYVRVHPNVLHLWSPVGVSIPMPPIETV